MNGELTNEIRAGVHNQLRGAESILGLALARLYLAKHLINVWRFSGVSEFVVGFSFPIDNGQLGSDGLPTSRIADSFMQTVMRFDAMLRTTEDKSDAASAATTAATIAAAAKHERKKAKKAAKALKRSQEGKPPKLSKAKSLPRKALKGMKKMFRTSDKLPSPRHVSRIRSVEVGNVTNVRHVAHVGLDANGELDMSRLPPEWTQVFSQAGVTNADLSDPIRLKVIMQTMGEFEKPGLSSLVTQSRSSAPVYLSTPAAPSTSESRPPKLELPSHAPKNQGPPTPPRPAQVKVEGTASSMQKSTNKTGSSGEFRNDTDGIRVGSVPPECEGSQVPPPLPPNKPPSPSSQHYSSQEAGHDRTAHNEAKYVNNKGQASSTFSSDSATEEKEKAVGKPNLMLSSIKQFDRTRLASVESRDDASTSGNSRSTSVHFEGIVGFDRTKLRSASDTPRPTRAQSEQDGRVGTIAEALRARLNSVRQQITSDNSSEGDDSDSSDSGWESD